MFAGIDEAGRGPVIGPLVMTIAASEDESRLKSLGVKDSKLLTEEQREYLFNKLQEFCTFETIIVSPKEVDDAVFKKQLNVLEAKTSAKLIDMLAKKIKLKEVVVDSPSRSTEKYADIVKSYLKSNVKIVSENKADLNYVIVGAASIVAKVTRDRAITDLKKKHRIDFGSGYPGDAKTQRFVKENYTKYTFFRKSWSTYKNAASGQQRTLFGFSDNKKENELLKLLQEGFVRLETKGSSEVLRIQKKDEATITLYTTGKVLVQGKEKEKWEKRVTFINR